MHHKRTGLVTTILVLLLARHPSDLNIVFHRLIVHFGVGVHYHPFHTHIKPRNTFVILYANDADVTIHTNCCNSRSNETAPTRALTLLIHH
ncbi:hypothetical protein EJ05DRAFT_89128 [Pseudovirgaria hyperparasitica]|uniref:Secreted protein n=1 Tax=Pseudovirgaria hyperparasitica TaxID=470096 RepID=A0A6A6W0N7_9PEZI|nr:uncharacterized protein EJ05DRAFT_89128 [Pseudovirgaria hyperparasitica]KAF2756075.1 hypothetical protein EJ05DRAFT_89128 [Pseudovirgaria hyperparasitica]